jgi:hypothetical protein
LPAFYLLLSEGVSRTFAEKWQALTIVIILAVNVSSTSSYLFNPKFHRENWRELSRVVGEDKIILSTTSQREALIYYDLGKNITPKEDLGAGERQIWLSRYVWNVFDPSDSTRKYIEDLGYNWSEELNLNGLVLWKYTYENRN